MPETTLSAKPSREALKQQLRDEARRQLTPNEFAQCEKIIHNAVLGSTGVGVAKLAVGLTAGLGGLAATALAPMAVMPQKLAALFGFQLKKTQALTYYKDAYLSYAHNWALEILPATREVALFANQTACTEIVGWQLALQFAGMRQQAQQPDVPADPPPEEPAKSIDPDDLVARAEEFFSGQKDPDKDSAAYDALCRDFAQAADQLPANLRALYVKLCDLGV